MTQPLYYEYAVQPGETITTIIHKLYGWSPPTRRYGEILDTIKALNPEVPSLHNLWPGTALRVSDRASTALAPPGPLFLSASPDPAERRQMWAMAWAERSGWLLAPGAVAMDTAAHLLSEGHLALLRQVGDAYAAYRAGHLTKGQSDHRRRVLVQQFADNVGPMEKLLFGGARTQEEIRIARAGGVPYDANIQRQVGRLRWLGKAAGAGGILLGGVGVVTGCLLCGVHGSSAKKQALAFDRQTADQICSTFPEGSVRFQHGWQTRAGLHEHPTRKAGNDIAPHFMVLMGLPFGSNEQSFTWGFFHY